MKCLILTGFEFSYDFTLNLHNIKKLYLTSCNYINYEESNILNDLSLYQCKLSKTNHLLKFPEIESLAIKDIINLNIDLSCLNKLKIYKGDVEHFLSLGTNLLEKVYLNSLLFEQKIIEKLISIIS